MMIGTVEGEVRCGGESKGGGRTKRRTKFRSEEKGGERGRVKRYKGEKEDEKSAGKQGV